MNVVELDTMRVQRYLDASIDLFMRDPPDSDFQRGFMSALIVLYREALGRKDDARLDALERDHL